jgi:hypothetical protein
MSGMTICEECASGKYSTNATDWICTACPIGFFQNSTGTTTCIMCPTGFTTNRLGVTACESCAPGWVEVNKTCLSCSSGKYSNQSANVCIDCPTGKFNEQDAASSLSLCSNCPSGRYSFTSGLKSLANCSRCPDSLGVSCKEDGATFIVLLPGYWFNGSQVTQCLPAAACSGGNYSGEYAFWIEENKFCSLGYVNMYCSQCATDYFRLSGLCKKCLSVGVRWFLMTISGLLAIFLLRLVIMSGRVSIPNPVRIFLYWFQILSMYPLLFQGWPQELNSFLNLLSVMNLEIGYFGIGCDLRNSFLQLMFAKLSLPIVLWICLLLLDILMNRGKVSYPRSISISSHCIFLLVFFSMQIFSSLFQIFNCIQREDGTFWLKADPQFQCYSSSWNTAVGVDCIFIILYFVFVPFFIWRQYVLTNKNVRDPRFGKLFGKIYQPYRQGCEGFEIVRVVFRFLFVVLRDLLNVNNIIRTSFFILIGFIQVWMEARYKPYPDEETNSLSML